MDPNSNSPELQAANIFLRRSLKPLLRCIPSQRVLNWLTHKRAPARGTHYDAAQTEWVKLGKVDTLCVTPDFISQANACMLYFHGGAYTIGSPTSSEADARRLAISSGMTVYSAKYMTAIHAPYPAAMDDAEAAYDALLALGTGADRIVLCGTSAGGGLALGLLHRLIARGRPLPACVITLSAWLDLTMSHPSIDTLAKTDVILSRAWTTRAAKLYAGKASLDVPEISPGNGNFEGAPPNLLLYSKVELFRDEIEAFAQKLKASDVEVEINHHNNAPHAWPMVAENAPETEDAFKVMAEFIARYITEPAK